MLSLPGCFQKWIHLAPKARKQKTGTALKAEWVTPAWTSSDKACLHLANTLSFCIIQLRIDESNWWHHVHWNWHWFRNLEPKISQKRRTKNRWRTMFDHFYVAKHSIRWKSHAALQPRKACSTDLSHQMLPCSEYVQPGCPATPEALCYRPSCAHLTQS